MMSTIKRDCRVRFGIGALALLGTTLALGCEAASNGITAPAVGAPTQLVKISGDAQSATPGASLTDKPTVRVLDAGGRAVPNATVAFTVTSGGGVLTGAQKVTDADGRASIDGWVLGSALGVNVLEAKLASAGLSTSFSALAGTAAVTASPVSVGAAGGVLRPVLTGSGLEGVSITVPAGAYAGTTIFSVETAPVPAGLASIRSIARLRIGNGGVTTDSVVEVRIPIRAPDGSLITPYWYDEVTKRIDPVPVVSEDSVSITLGIPSFTWRGVAAMSATAVSGMRTGAEGARPSIASAQALLGDLLLASVDEADLLKLTFIASSYSTRQDDWEFGNEGSELSPGGNCHGQTMSAAWYHDVIKGSGGLGLFERFAPPAALRIPALEGKDNALGYRFASVVQADLNAAVYSTLLRRWEMARSVQKRNWLRLLDALRATGQPQLMAVSRTGTSGPEGHALLAYKASPTTGAIWVADPNHPGDPDRRITFDRSIGLYTSYQGGTIKTDNDALSFPTIRYIPRSYALGWGEIATRWAEVQAQTIGAVAPRTFSSYVLFASRGTGTMDYLKPGVTVYDDSVTIGARESTIWVTGYDSAGAIGAKTAADGERRMALAMGANRIGAYMAVKPAAGYRFVDFQRLTVTRKPLALATAAGVLVPLGDTLRFDSGEARKFTLRYDDGSLAPDVPYVKTSLRAVTGAAGVNVTRSAFADGVSFMLTAADTGRKVVRFELWYGSRLVRSAIAVVAKPSIVLTPFTSAYTGTRTTELTGGVLWGVLTCKMPWKADVLGSAKRVAIGEEYIVTPTVGAPEVNRVTWTVAEQVHITEGTYSGTGTWWWRKGVAPDKPAEWMPFTVQWAIRYRDVATGVEGSTNAVTMSCQ